MFRFVETFHHFFAFCLSVFWILLVKHQRVLGGEAETEEQKKVTAETVEPAPEKKPARKKSAAKKTADKKSASVRSTSKTAEKPSPKKSGGRKKKSETPKATGESQVSTL